MHNLNKFLLTLLKQKLDFYNQKLKDAPPSHAEILKTEIKKTKTEIKELLCNTQTNK